MIKAKEKYPEYQKSLNFDPRFGRKNIFLTGLHNT
jgi:hypothetical protein